MTDPNPQDPHRFSLGKRRFAIPRFKIPGGGKLRYLVIVAAVVVFAYNLLFVYVQPNEFGIKVVRLGIHRGVQKDYYTAGLNLVIPGMQQMYRLPRDVQVLELTDYPQTAADLARKDRVAHIQTSDGFFVDVDVSIIYHIVDPYLVFTKIGPGTLFEDNGIIPKAEPALKETLGKLTTEDFYNSPLRVKKAQEARDLLNQELKPKGIEVNQVLVRYFRYSPEIQKNIEEKKLKDQLVFTNQAAARAAIEEAQLKKIIQEGRVSVDVQMEQGRAYVTRKIAEKDLYRRTKMAEADLLVKLAEAEKVRLKNDALKGVGSERMVGLKMADVYKGLDLIVLPSDGQAGVNPLDLNNALKLFDVRKGGAQ
ncbi:putative inner membrane protein, band 7 family [Desulfosarcina cetonica]|uniref:SPFH domain-containing protein n=1 Tax=Desulfosarcina cetonica TaxID=90730 RepID=UPI0006D1D4D2|nr:SPFH domain-containing protein [Desulfosarcina cetonica]VTR70821.1 putative inner membrane protein, band 7 family [Desulfosarcina cetonica]